jgi:hypothetical protein
MDMSILFWIIFLPEALSAPEIGNTALYRDACPGESDCLF